jgi:hypothetical protein
MFFLSCNSVSFVSFLVGWVWQSMRSVLAERVLRFLDWRGGVSEVCGAAVGKKPSASSAGGQGAEGQGYPAMILELWMWGKG